MMNMGVSPVALPRVRSVLQPRDANVNGGGSMGRAMPIKVPQSQQLRGNAFSESLAKLREAETKRVTSFSGWLTKKPVVHKSRGTPSGTSKSRFFRLTSDALYYYRDETCAVLRGRVAFSESTRVRLTPTPRCFELEDDSVLCSFTAAAEADCDDWVVQLQHVVEAYQVSVRQVMAPTDAVQQQQQQHQPPQQRWRIRDAVLGRESRNASFTEQPQQQQERLFSSSISIIVDRPSAGDALADDYDVPGVAAAAVGADGGACSPDIVPTLMQALSTCKKRAPIASQRIAAAGRQDGELDISPAVNEVAVAAAANATTTAALQAQLLELQAQLLARQQMEQGELRATRPNTERAVAAAAAAAAAANSTKAEQALLKRRMNIEAHHETCNCSIM